MKRTSRSKKKLSPATLSKNNNFSENYLRYTGSRKFMTPKKTVVFSDIKEVSGSRNQLKIDQQHFALQKPSKININMQIKNLNIFGPSTLQSGDTKKKKLHKKTISALGRHQKELKERQNPKNQFKQTKSQLIKKKHGKTKSQDSIKLSPKDWGKLLAQNVKATDLSAQLISKYSLCNRQGMAADLKEKINQDTYILIENFMKLGRYLFGVCDGHGINGHFVSDFVKEILPENIEYFFIKHKALKKCPKNVVQSALRDAFLKTARDLEESGIDINFSGSTACLIYLHDHTLYCANLGDSRAVIFSRINDKWQARPLSFDHKAQDEREACRIRMNGGRVFPYHDEDGEPSGPFRIWIQQKDIPGLAMTRSFGDYIASTVGLISQPQVSSYQVTKDDKYMIIASDGLWQFISNEQVMEIATPAFVRNNAQEAVRLLQRMAVQAWQRQDESIDDITIQVIFFKYY